MPCAKEHREHQPLPRTKEEKAQNPTNPLVWRRPVLRGLAATDVCGKEGAVSGKSQISVFTHTVMNN